MDWNALFEELSVSLGETLPTFAGAIGLLIVGWFVALVVRAVIRGALTRVGLNERIAASTGREADVAGGVGKGAYYLVLLIALVAFFNVLEIEYASASLQSLVDQVLGFVPKAIAAGVLLAVAWLLAVVLRAGATRALSATSIDEKLSDEAGMRPLSESLGNVLYGLVFLLFLPGILGALEMEGLLAPVQGMLDEMLGILPNVFGAGVIGAVGVFVARIVRDLVTNLLRTTGIDRLGESAGLAGSMALSGLLGLVAYVFILVPALIAALNALEIESISGPATRMLGTFMDALPNVFAAAIILGVAWLVAGFLSNLASSLSDGLGVDRIPERLGMPSSDAESGSLSRWIGSGVSFFVMLFALTEAANRLGFAQLSTLVATLIGFTGQVLLGGVIIAAGVWIANAVHAAMLRMAGDESASMAGLARYAVLGLVGAMGLRAMGLADDIVNLAFGLTLGSIAVAFALSFGLGGREAAGEHMQHWLRRMRSE